MNKLAVLGGKPIFESQAKLVDITFSDRLLIHKRIDKVLDSSQLTNDGKYLLQLEREISARIKTPSLAVANATLGLILAMKGLGVKGNIIMPSFTFCATSHSAVWAGLKPKFVDIDAKTLNIDPKRVEEAVDDNTVAIIGVHTFGNPCDVDVLVKIAKKHSLKLLFDAAHAFGAEYKGKPVGGFGDAEVFSTHATKTLVTGEGGFVATNDKKLFDYVKRGRNFGFDDKNSDTLFYGTNAKMTELGAIIGLDSLKGLDVAVKRKNETAKLFIKRLSKVPGLSFQQVTPGAKHAHLFFGMLVDEKEFGIDRDKLSQALAAENIMTRKYFYPPIHRHSSYKEYAPLNLPVTERVSKSVLCLPINAKLSPEKAGMICDAIENIHANAAAIDHAI